MGEIMHENGKLLFVKHAVPVIRSGDSVIEVGPSRKRHDIKESMTGVDYHYADLKNFDIGSGRVLMKDQYTIQADDGQFDCVVAAQVIEHVTNPFTWMKELARVSRRVVVIVGPVSFEYHCPPDHWRIFAEGMRSILDDAGLRVGLALTESLDGIHTDTIGIGYKGAIC